MPRILLFHFLALLPVWIVGLVHLPHPFEGDQALFMVGAQHLEAGDQLYEDFWDVKQPGIYLFYWLAGKWFGFTEVGVHVLELIWFTLWVPPCVALLRGYFDRPWLAGFVPLATIGMYYGMSAREHLTQLEILVGPLLFLCAALTAREWKTGRAQALAWLASGALASVVVTFKLALAPIALTVWTVAVGVRFLKWRGARRGDVETREQEHEQGEGEAGKIVRVTWWARWWGEMRQVVVDLGAGFVGGASVLGMVLVAFHFHGSLERMLWTSFEYPVQAIAGTQLAPINRLLGSASWFLSHTGALLMFFLCFGLARWRGLDRETLTLQMMGWLVVACFVVVMQRWSWWQYHFLILIVPAGVLGIRGVDAAASSDLFASRPVWRTAQVAALAFVLTCPMWVNWSVKARQFVKHTRLGTSWYGPYQIETENAYREIWEATHFLREDESRGPIHVFGDPLYLYLSEREQALPEKGWVAENHLPSQWAELPDKLQAVRPEWIFVDAKNRPLLLELAPGAQETITKMYDETRSCERGTWFRLKEEG